MAVQILKSRAEIKAARGELRRRALSFTSPGWKQIARKIAKSETINVGDVLKSWDVLKTLKFLEGNVERHAPILDIGAFASELPCILHNAGYSNIVGVDLNPNIKKMPYADCVRYEVLDFMRTPFEDASFQAITAISVIEHGFNSGELLTEVSRLLRPDGYFIASFDYWPDKVDSSGVKIFGLDWTIFSAKEVRKFLDDAAQYRLYPSGGIDLAGEDRPIESARRNYTFAWLALRKTIGTPGT